MSLNTDTRQAQAPQEYLLDPVYAEQCQVCRAPESGWFASRGASYDTSRHLIDSESDLRNLDRLNSKDPMMKYSPSQRPSEANYYHFPSCDHGYQYTRLTNPTCTLRETGVNRFQPICLNPQDPTRWEHPAEIGINYRMVAKDNHIPMVPVPMDQTAVLPKEDPSQQLLTMSVPANSMAPLHNYYRYRPDLRNSRFN